MSEAREEYYKIYDDNGSLLDGSGYLRRTVHNYLKELEEQNETMKIVLKLIRDRGEYLSVDIIYMIEEVLK